MIRKKFREAVIKYCKEIQSGERKPQPALEALRKFQSERKKQRVKLNQLKFNQQTNKQRLFVCEEEPEEAKVNDPNQDPEWNSQKDSDSQNNKKKADEAIDGFQVGDAEAAALGISPTKQTDAQKKTNTQTNKKKDKLNQLELFKGNEAKKTDDQLTEMLKMVERQNNLLMQLDRKIQKKIQKKTSKQRGKTSTIQQLDRSEPK